MCFLVSPGGAGLVSWWHLSRHSRNANWPLSAGSDVCVSPAPQGACLNVTEVFRRKRRAAQRRPNLFLSRIRFSLPADGITGFRRSSGGIAEAVQGHGRESISNLRSLPPPQAIENTPPTARSIRDGIRSVKHSGNRGAGFQAAFSSAQPAAEASRAAGGPAALIRAEPAINRFAPRRSASSRGRPLARRATSLPPADPARRTLR